MKNRKTRSAMRRMLFTLALVLVVAVASVGGTIAWLTASTAPVTNTFTVGDINIELTETGATNNAKQYKIIPGTDLSKDPKVTVKAGSEACWLFVKVEEVNWPTAKEDDGTTRKVKYAIADDWTLVEGQTNVYYRVVDATTAATGVSYYVLKGDTTYANGVVTVSENLTKTEAEAIGTGNSAPKLTFTAYAVQKDNIADAATAWAKVSGN